MVSDRCEGSNRQAIRHALTASLIALLALQGATFAETVTTGELRMSAAFLSNSDGLSSYPGWAIGGISVGIDSARSDSIKASIRASLDTMTNADGSSSSLKLTLDRAYAKVRFPWLVENTSLRVTAGKAPLSWGKGFVFNAGDPIFGSLPESSIAANNTAEFRTATSWMAVADVPLGDFSFAELAWLAPIEGRTNRGGGRMFLSPGLSFLHSVECGFLLTEKAYRSAYLALDGSLFFDWYAAASLAELAKDPSGINGTARYTVSFGVFRIFDFIQDIPLTLRAEGLVYPEENRQLWFQSLQANITDSFSLTLEGLFATGTDDPIVLAELESSSSTLSLMEGGTGLAGIVARLSPIKGFTLSASVLKQFEKGDPLKPAAIITASGKYIF